MKLKIIDSIDLKELEKYGFKEDNFWWERTFEYDTYKVEIYVYKGHDRGDIVIKNDYYDGDFTCHIPGVLYDLIKDGLAEKVDDKYE